MPWWEISKHNGLVRLPVLLRCAGRVCTDFVDSGKGRGTSSRGTLALRTVHTEAGRLVCSVWEFFEDA